MGYPDAFVHPSSTLRANHIRVGRPVEGTIFTLIAVVLLEETLQPTGLEKSSSLTLVRGQWLVPTVLLWNAFMTNLAAFYAVQSWLPTIIQLKGTLRAWLLPKPC